MLHPEEALPLLPLLSREPGKDRLLSLFASERLFNQKGKGLAWYMAQLLGRGASPASAQAGRRLGVPLPSTLELMSEEPPPSPLPLPSWLRVRW